jgi:hypothetical protein
VSAHEQMSDDEVLRAVAGLLSALPVPAPPEATAIMARGRTRWPRRRAGAGLAATAAAHHELRAAPRAPRARRLLTWQGPAAAVVVVLLVAAALIALKSLRNEHAAPVTGPGAVAGVPRYYVELGSLRPSTGREGWGIIVGDDQSRRVIDSIPFLPESYVHANATVSGAGDDRTFVVSDAIGQSTRDHSVVFSPTTWDVVRIFPGSADPVRVTKLPIKLPADGPPSAIALSGDGTELAVASGAGASKTRRSVALGVYSVATGRLQHSWSATISTSADDLFALADLSWVGDKAVGFAVMYNPGVREEVRTLPVSATGTDLLTDSRVVWSQYVKGPRGDVYQESTPRACGTPFLTGNGQAVVCGNDVYSARDKRVSAVWLAYPVATPTRAHVIGSVPQPKDVSSVSPVTVEWINPSGTEVLGTWNPSVVTFPGGVKDTSTTNFNALIGDGQVRTFTRIQPRLIAW